MDSRLIHGQILVAWSSDFKIDRIIVTNDKVAADPLQVTLLEANAPIGTQVSVLSIKDCAAYSNSAEAEKENIFIIAKYPEDGLALVEEGLKMPVLNLGNQAFVRGSQKVSNTVFLTESGFKALRKLHEMGVRITCRMMPPEADCEYWPTLEKPLLQWAT
jgi:mannose/fructose/N-acetylgalactosamine-specific phosphotransferase system component IIB